MTRPTTIEQLEAIYAQMTEKWLNSPTAWTWNASLKEEGQETKKCLAIYSMDHWKLEPATWQRLKSWLQPLIKEGISFTPNPNPKNPGQGLLHFTFHQLSGFKEDHNTSFNIPLVSKVLKEYLNEIAGLKLIFRGLCVTPTGLALRGFPEDSLQCKKLMNLRNRLQEILDSVHISYDPPYMNDICHATLFRWTQQPSEASIDYIQKSLHTWDEAVIASYTCSSWTLGLGSLKMLDSEREDFITIPTPLPIAHRGLFHGPSHIHENKLETLKTCVKGGISAECDIWLIDGRCFLGHDAPTTEFLFEDISSPYIWFHAKNKEAFEFLVGKRYTEGIPLTFFWHTTEDYIFTSNSDIIVYPGKPLFKNTVFMMPEFTVFPELATKGGISAVCTDFKLK